MVKINKRPALNQCPPIISTHYQGPKIQLLPRALNQITAVIKDKKRNVFD